MGPMNKKYTPLPLLLLLAAGGLSVSACGSTNSSADTGKPTPATTAAPATTTPAAAQAPAHSIDVTLNEFAVKPSTVSAKAGKVTITATNDGKAPHELVVLRTTKGADALGSGARIKETGHVGEIGDLPAGKTGKVTLKLAPGHYALVCNLPGHYAAGMHADLTVVK